jgi:hypothetical protein
MRLHPALLAWLTLGLAVAAWSARAHALPVVERRAIVPAGEGMLSMGAGTWLRESTNVTVGHLDLRVGVLPRLEVRILLPGVAFEAVVERDGGIPALVLFLGLCEAGFNTLAGATLAYQVGARVSKRVLSRLRLAASVELRHRLLGTETAELAVVGPLPANRAFVAGGELTLQLFEALALTGQLGYAQALGGGRSFGFGGAGLLATVRGRLDVYASALLERSRSDRTFAPAVFGGIAMRF